MPGSCFGRKGCLWALHLHPQMFAVGAIGIVAGSGHLLSAVFAAAVVLIDLELRYVPVVRVVDGIRYASHMKPDE